MAHHHVPNARVSRRQLLVTALGVGGTLACGTSRAASRESAHDVMFKDLAGRTTTLRSMAGQVVVLNAFTTWDLVCLRGIPDLRRLASDRAGKVAVVGVGMDMDGQLALATFEKTLKPGYPVWLPDAAFREGRTVFGSVESVPRTFLVGRDGSVRGGWVGYVPYADLQKLADAELAR